MAYSEDERHAWCWMVSNVCKASDRNVSYQFETNDTCRNLLQNATDLRDSLPCPPPELPPCIKEMKKHCFGGVTLGSTSSAGVTTVGPTPSTTITPNRTALSTVGPRTTPPTDVTTPGPTGPAVPNPCGCQLQPPWLCCVLYGCGGLMIFLLLACLSIYACVYTKRNKGDPDERRKRKYVVSFPASIKKMRRRKTPRQTPPPSVHPNATYETAEFSSLFPDEPQTPSPNFHSNPTFENAEFNPTSTPEEPPTPEAEAKVMTVNETNHGGSSDDRQAGAGPSGSTDEKRAGDRKSKPRTADTAGDGKG